MSTPATAVSSLFDLAIRQQRVGNLVEAIRGFRDVLAIEPLHARAQHQLGILALHSGAIQPACAHLKTALEANPRNGEYWATYLLALIQARAYESVQSMVENAAANGLPPDWVGALNYQMAMARHGTPVAPTLPAIAQEVPSHDLALLDGLDAMTEADEWVARAGALTMQYPYSGQVWKALGGALVHAGASAEAFEPLRLAAALLPSDTSVQSWLGNAYLDRGEYREAYELFHAISVAEPANMLNHSSLLFSLNFLTDISQADKLKQAQRFGDAARQLAQTQHNPVSRTLALKPHQPLRIGLVSGDLREHPVGYFLQGLLAKAAPASILWFAYSTNKMHDALTDELAGCCRAFRVISGQSDSVAAKTIRADDIDILIDLAGHTGNNRLPLFCHRPAPVQLAWLGYFATTGLREIDGVIVDHQSICGNPDEQFVEPVFYLPDTRLCFTPPVEAPHVSPLPASRNGYITFASFQPLAKVGQDVLTLWKHVLDAVPTARLRIQSPALAIRATREQFLRRVVNVGIAPARVALHLGTDRQSYLAAHAEVDVVLDSFPYTGGTTTCEALWMGVPTLTLAGETLLARQGASLLRAAGLPEWIAGDSGEYVAKAQTLTSDVQTLAALRAGMRDQLANSALFDAARFARAFEDLMVKIWQARCAEAGVGADAG